MHVGALSVFLRRCDGTMVSLAADLVVTVVFTATVLLVSIRST